MKNIYVVRSYHIYLYKGMCHNTAYVCEVGVYSTVT